MEKVDGAQKFSLFQEYLSPKLTGVLNASYVHNERTATDQWT